MLKRSFGLAFVFVAAVATSVAADSSNASAARSVEVVVDPTVAASVDPALLRSEIELPADQPALDENGATPLTINYGNTCDGNICYTYRWECVGSTCTMKIIEWHYRTTCPQ